MSLIGAAIFISILVTLVFGWEYMINMWETAFDMAQRLVEAIIERIEVDKP